jgi:hypothetical protein
MDKKIKYLSYNKIIFNNMNGELINNYEFLQKVCNIDTTKYDYIYFTLNDYNTSSIRKNWKKSQNYFSLKVSQLEKYGLRPVYVTGNFPSKVSLGIGIVVAKKIQ